tara:strand:- start:17083 stop:18327 length:1245 start_codon:yes stop_codon:yes gene_type:complete
VINRVFITLIFIQSAWIGVALAQSPVGLDDAVGLPLRAETDFLTFDDGMIDSQAAPELFTSAAPILSCDAVPDLCDAVPGSCNSCETGCSGCVSCEAGCSDPLASRWTPLSSLHSRVNTSFSKLDLSWLDIGANFRDQRTRDRGIGYERVMYAPNVLDTAIQVPHVGFRYQLNYGLNVPDRAEYFWGAGTTNNAETGVDAQDLSVRLAIGNEKAMALTQYTLRSLDPEAMPNTTGMSDMIVGAQAMLVDGKSTKLATILRTYIATGSSSKGLGTGHTSLEYGLIARQCVSPETFLFGELKYWMPIGGTSDISGDVLSTGLGISTIASESDVFAFLPTLEIRTLSFLFGGQTPAGSTTSQRIDGITAVELYPGGRFVFDRHSDLGLVEFGFSAGITVADDEWFDTRWIFDLRFSR